MKSQLSTRHFLLALAVVAVWGTNFVVIKQALHQVPPLLFATLRFAAVSIPGIFFVSRPSVSWQNLATYGVCIGVGQFGLMFVALDGLISPGLASLVIQMQVFFTIGMAMVISGERLNSVQVMALVLATTGLGVIVLHIDVNTTPLGLALMLGAAFSWSSANIASRKAGPANMVTYVIWSSLFAVPPLAALSVAVEGLPAIEYALASATPVFWGAVVWQAVANSLFGYAAWGWLLGRYPAATVTPMALLIPIFGMGSSAMLLGEELPVWKLVAAGLVIGGLGLNLLWPHLGKMHWRMGR